VSKPHWIDAPAWAEWLAQDSDGEWFWWESMPILIPGKAGWTGGGRHKWARKTPNYEPFGLTLERRR